MKPIFITLIVLCAQLTYAQTAPLDKLKKLYETASAPKSMAAAEAAVAATTNCAEASPSSPGAISSPHRLVTLSYSTPSQGPEFPSVTTSLIAVIESSMERPAAEYAMDGYRPVLTGQELQLETKSYESHYKCHGGTDDDNCWDTISTEIVKLNIRLSAKYVLYQLDRDTYGYCWKQ